jgi:hypothetical protein
MPRKKKVKPIFEDEARPRELKIKTKTLFDHINAITQIQDKKYFSKISDGDKKTWSNYMINRFLSMNPDWIEIIAELDPMTTGAQLKPEFVYKMYIDIIPKSRVFLKYIKGKKANKYSKELVDLLRKHFECSKKEVTEYLDIYYMSDSKKEDLVNIIKMYGIEDKEIKRMIKI